MRPLGRRALLVALGRGTLAVAVLGAAACAPGEPEPGRTTPRSGTTTPEGGLAHHRVDLGFVSAYVLVRGGRAALVDTGTAGSAPEIQDVLRGVGLGWDAVGDVVVTHHHPDHQGSLGAVLEAARTATAHAGAADREQIDSPRPLQAVGDGDEVFGLQIVTTPGHTSGHISVLDRETRVLVVGDALIGRDGGVAGPDPEFTADVSTARESVRKLAGLDFDTILFGHGEPVTSEADRKVVDLTRTL